ncbi:hypothetical protein [Acetitomaculum ruminis]|uniref:hypothetical protein n=1 Tax=Acetitomaculum ruminis TaxID=2382 RepID=UPI001FA9163E
MKREWLNRFNIRNQRYAYRLIFEYIEAFYNTIRIHSHCALAAISSSLKERDFRAISI